MDMEKIIKGLEDSLTNQGCGYMDGVGELYAVSGEDLQNAIAMLKEQKGIIESLESDLAETLDVVSNRKNVVRCKDCKWKKWMDADNEVVFCKCQNTSHDWNWFCADGERRETE